MNGTPAHPIARTPWAARAANRLWPKATQVLLLLIGAGLALGTFVVVLAMPDAPYHPARDLELKATYESYRESGVLLVKQNGTGSWYGQVEGSGLTRAAGDDDPGSYLVASLMSHVTNSDSPYPGLRIVMALIIALPLLLLPLTVARVYRRARAGYAMLLLPPVMWLINHGTILVGTEYGLSDAASPTRVYALYGMASALAFASLVLLTYLSTRRLSLPGLLGWTLAIVALGASGNLLRSMSGVAIAFAVGVLWWASLRWRRRFVRGIVAVGVSGLAAWGSLLVPQAVMSMIDDRRADVIQSEASELPAAHGTWHPLYLGLSYPQPITGVPSKFGIVWSDEFGWNKAREIDPDVRIASAEYDAIMKDLYLDIVRESPLGVARLYVEKLLFTVKHFAAMLVVIFMGFALAWRRPGRHRVQLRRALAIASPTLLLGLLPAVLVVPLLYYYVELIAALGILTALAFGGLFWAYSSLPSYVRSIERRRISERGILAPNDVSKGLSVIVPSRNGAAVLPQTLELLGTRLGERDEIVVVENGSTDGTADVLDRTRSEWQHAASLVVTRSEPGLGHALRTGVLASSGARLLLSADDLPFGFSDLDQFEQIPDDVVVAIGSKAHPASEVSRSARRTAQSSLFRVLRSALLHSSVGDSQGTIWVDGQWARMFASLSREQGLMWTVELVLAAEQQGHDVWEVPVRLAPAHDSVASRFTLRDARIAVRELVRLALQKDDYVEDDWSIASRQRPTHQHHLVGTSPGASS